MLAYPLDEAETLLDSKLDAAKTSLGNCDEDLDFLREQITVRPSLSFLRCLGVTSLIDSADDGSRHSSRLQLGRRATKKGQSGWQRRGGER